MPALVPSPVHLPPFRPRVSVLLVALLLVLTACAPAGSGTAPAATATPPAAATASPATATPAASPSPAATASPTEPPDPSPATGVTVVDDEGTSVTLPTAPQRIVSLAPSITETVFALGAGDRLVAGTDFDDHPAEAVALPDVATFQGVDVERIVALEADLVIAQGDLGQADAVARLRQVPVPVIVLLPTDLERILADIRLVGRAIGAEQEAEGVVAGIDSRQREVADALGTITERPRVFYEIGYDPQNLYGPTEGSFTADLIRIAGGDAITTGSPTNAVMSLERLVQADPQVIVLGDAAYLADPSLAGVRARGAAWAGLTAVKEGAVRPVNDVIVTRPGPRIGEGLAELARAIHPGIAVTPPATPAPSLTPVPSASAPASPAP